jgi:hypothetical protein
MPEVDVFSEGGYRFIRGVYPYSAGVAAQPGFEIERVRFRRALPLADGFAAIHAHLKNIARPVTALCACELRSPAPFSEGGFTNFNRSYVNQLGEWSIFRDNVNPVARSNVCPEVLPPSEPSIHAFSYTVPAGPDSRPTFVIAGSSEVEEGKPNYRDYAVRLGDTSVDGLRAKARFTLEEMERRMHALGFGWSDTTALQLYTVHDTWPFLEDEMARRGAINGGLTWHYTRPPVVDLEYELDTRGVFREIVIANN